MVILETTNIKVQIALKGAELSSLYNKATGMEHIWQADAAYWDRHSPILFPIVGTLKDGKYQFQDKDYYLPRHGFARDCYFEIEQQNTHQVTLRLQSDAHSLKVFPFHFILKVSYTLLDDSLSVAYAVENIGAETMYFSIGAHPAFNVPICPSLTLDDYTISINADTNYPISRHLINENGLQNGKTLPVLNSPLEKIPLSNVLFNEDALIFKNIPKAMVEIATEKDAKSLRLTYTGFSYLGIWSKPGAPFVCIEPWSGITDHEDCNGQLVEKEGILSLEPFNNWNGSWEVRIDSSLF